MGAQMTRAPLVSVIMNVYNGAEYLKESIDSILEQTFKDFEFIIIDDGSTDKSKDIIESYDDDRIILISRPNKGIVASSLESISYSRGKYIARQDADDISFPDRLSKMVEILENNQETGVVGSARQNINMNGEKLDLIVHPLKDADIRVAMYNECVISNGSSVFRKSDYNKTCGYEEGFPFAEDYRLWTKMLEVTKVVNIESPLYYYRTTPDAATANLSELSIETNQKIKDYMLKRPYTMLRGARPGKKLLLQIMMYGFKNINIKVVVYPFVYIIKGYGLLRALGHVFKIGGL